MEGGRVSSSGLFWAVISSFFFSLCSLLAKYLDLSPVQMSWFGFLGTVLMTAPIALKKGQIFPKGYMKLFMLRAIAGTVFLIMSFYSVELIPLGDASVLFYTAPVFTIILAKIYLREPCTVSSVIIIIVIMCGVMLVTRPPFIFSHDGMQESYILGATMALAASFSEAVGNVILRELNSSLHFSVITFNHGLISLILSSFLLIFTGWEVPEISKICLIALLSLLTSMEQILMALALSTTHAGPVALVQASDIIFGYIYQVAFFGENVELISALGALLIAFMVFQVARTKPPKENSSIRV